MTAPDVVSFVRARLDEHAETARRAQGDSDGRWAAIDKDAGWNGHRDVEVVEGLDPDWIIADVGNGALADRHAQAKHIALNDPMHVLAWVAAARAILAAHELRDEQGAIPGAGAHVIASRAVGLRIAIRALAAVWRTHPDYDPTWTPDHRHDFGPDRDQPCPCGYPAPPF